MADANPYGDLVPSSKTDASPYADLVPKSGFGAQAADFASQALGSGFNKGINSFLSLPGDVMAWGAEKIGVPHETADKLRFKNNPVSDFLTHGPKPTTTAGRYGEQIGHALGASAIPAAVTMGLAPTMAAMAPSQSAVREGFRELGQSITQAPAQAAAFDAASAVSSGAAQQAAKEAELPPVLQSVAGLAGGFAPVLGTATLPSRQLATARSAAAAADIEAHRDFGIRPFGPAFMQGPNASIAKQLSDTAIVGSPLKNALDESLTNTRDAVGRVAQSMGPAAEHNEMGLAVQNALSRYRSAGVNAVDEDALRGVGINQTSANVPTNRMMSRAAEGRAEQADQTRVQQGEAPQPINRISSQRRSVGDLSDRELDAIITSPSAQTSFAAKAEALYERAWRSIPNLVRSNGSAGNDRLQAVNTRAAMSNIDDQVANQISGQSVINRDLAQRLMGAKSHFSIDELRSIRTEVGRALGNYGVGPASLDRSQLRQLYGALSRDLEVGTMDLANRARIFSTLSPNDPRYVPPQQVAAAERSLAQMRRADQFFAAGQDRIDNFMRVIGAATPEAASRLLTNAALGQGRGNIQMLRTARAALRPEEWNMFSSNVLRNLGAPIGSARGTTQEIGFSVGSFMTRWNNMTPQAQRLLFGGEHARAIDNLVRVISRLANVEALANTSRSATNVVNVSGALTIGTTAATGHVALALGQLSTGFGLSVLMSRPAWANWATKYAILRSHAVNSPVVGDRVLAHHIATLGQMARAEPILAPIYREVADDNGGRHAR